jgi:hypothetical protein
VANIIEKDPVKDNDSSLEEFETGKVFLFWHPDHSNGTVLSFSSTLNNVGVSHDRFIKNRTKVLALSEPIEAFHPTYGELLVTKILADEIMYVNTFTLHPINDN